MSPLDDLIIDIHDNYRRYMGVVVVAVSPVIYHVVRDQIDSRYGVQDDNLSLMGIDIISNPFMGDDRAALLSTLSGLVRTASKETEQHERYR